ncbi:MAG: hypothetical protein FJ247_09410 [Nitrospira sp.]|nr:hypothetical protein [Nitrospira sp.]
MGCASRWDLLFAETVADDRSRAVHDRGQRVARLRIFQFQPPGRQYQPMNQWMRLALLVGLAAAVPGADVWAGNPVLSAEPQQPKTEATLLGLQFRTPQVGWTVGSGGTILKTVNGGKRWKKVVSGTSVLLTNVLFIDGKRGWVIGSNGTVRTSTDGGESWRPVSVATEVPLYGISFPTPAHGWIVGGNGMILHTDDGGMSWHEQSSHTNATLYAVAFSSEQHGVAVGAVGTALVTLDGGTTWTAPGSLGGVTLFGFEWSDLMIGWAVGNAGALFQTTDGGLHWTDRTIPCLQTCTKPIDLLRVRFTGPQTGWIVGERGMVYRTIDAGFTWQEAGSIANVSLFGLTFPDEGHAWASGERGTMVQIKPMR